jgi:adenylosuccinate lyase
VELAALDARATLGEIPSDFVTHAASIPPPEVTEVDDLEAVTRHDFEAFLRAWTAPMDEPTASWVHRGLTSSDIVDTAQSLLIADAGRILEEALDTLVNELRSHSLRHASTLRLGRTHGMAAMLDTWGHRVADFAFAIARCRDRLIRTTLANKIAKLSGPVGNYAGLDPRLEQIAAERLGLQPAPCATQVLLRDSLADWVSSLSLIATSCEAIALEVRHGQRTEVGELAEGFTARQAGSSAMPHKRNPISSEKVCGLARVVRSFVTPVTEGIALWHERDISHSSVERICLPDASSLTEHIVVITADVIAGLVVNTERMEANIERAGEMIYSDIYLLMLLNANISRVTAYELIQKASREASDGTSLAALVRSAAMELGIELPDVDVSAMAIARVLDSPGLSDVFARLERLS